MKKGTKISFIFLFILLFAISGCSLKKEADPKSLSFWQTAKANHPTIWFDINDGNIAKDSIITTGYVVENKTIKKYILSPPTTSEDNSTKQPNVTLSDFDKLNTNQIIKHLKKIDKDTYAVYQKNLKNQIDSEQKIIDMNKQRLATTETKINDASSEYDKNWYSGFIKNYKKDIESSEKSITNLNELLNQQYTAPKPKKISNINLYTDDSGNTVTSEIIQVSHSSTNQFRDNDSSNPLEFKAKISPKEVLNNYYIGYATGLNAKNKPRSPYIVTKINNDKTIINYDDGKDSIFTKK